MVELKKFTVCQQKTMCSAWVLIGVSGMCESEGCAATANRVREKKNWPPTPKIIVYTFRSDFITTIDDAKSGRQLANKGATDFRRLSLWASEMRSFFIWPEHARCTRS